MMEYTARYGLEFDPFLKNSKEVVVQTTEFKEAVYRLNHLAKTCGFGLLTGAPGLGKSTALRYWARSLNPSLFKVIYSCLSTLPVNEFYSTLAANLGAQPAFRKSDNFRIIQGEISRLSLEKRIIPVIIMDEANYLKHATLNDLKLLFNFEMDSKDRAVIVLAGLPQINTILNLSIHESLRQRIIVNYSLEAMSKEEGRSYILAKLEGAQGQQQFFEDPAIDAILNAANGVPRLINKYCSTSLVIANSLEAKTVNTDIVMKALNDSELV